MAGDALLTTAEAAASVCVLETIGRTSGEPRRLEIWFATDGRTVFLLAGGRDRAHWVRNLRAKPAARVRVRGRWVTGTAREVEGTADDPVARRLIAEKYGLTTDGSYDEWLRTSLPIAIDLSQ